MDILTISLWLITAGALVLSLKKDRSKTLQSMKSARNMMKNMLGSILGILFLIGLILTFIPPTLIQGALGRSNEMLATVIAALAGSVTLIPAFVAFPLINSFTSVGASIVPATAFLTTLTMVGIVTFPLEKKEFGASFALIRNAFSFFFAIIIALLMGVIL